jgi:hypothetical protein
MSRKAVILGLLISFSLLAGVCFGKYSGGTGEPNDPYLIATPNDLNSIGLDPCDWDKHFLMTADIDLSGFTGTQFNIIGPNLNTPFIGMFDGNGHSISNFSYECVEGDYVGLFGIIDDPNAEIKALTLIDPNVSATDYSVFEGCLVGKLMDGTISSCGVQGGNMSAEDGIGGLVGANYYGTISNCYATASVSGYHSTGGLAGRNQWAGKISHCYVSGSVSGHYGTGGLVGHNDGTISHCYATASVSGHSGTGGLVGSFNRSGISHCYATGSVSGYSETGGLVGRNLEGGISNCYSTGPVSGNDHTGGLVGGNAQGRISNCYSTGAVDGNDHTGGLVGGGDSRDVTNSFWDIETGGPDNDIGTPLTTEQMQTKSTFLGAGWDFVGETANGYEDIWRMCVDGVNYPKLSWEFLGYGDLTCPDGVDFIDYSVLADEWRLEGLEQDYNSDGRVNFKDWAIFANNWEGNYTELPPFVACWLARSARIADIAPAGGDDFVNWQDLAILAMHWLDEK